MATPDPTELTFEKLQKCITAVQYDRGLTQRTEETDLEFGLRKQGLDVLVQRCDYLGEEVQFQFPRSKKKRIIKKWRRNFRNFRRLPCKKMFLLDPNLMANSPWPEQRKMLLGDSFAIAALSKQVEENNEQRLV